MKSLPALLCAGAMLAAMPGQSAHATVIVDTGPGPVAVGGTNLDPTQSLAAEFVLEQDSTITSIEGWISVFRADTTFKAAILSDAGDVPGSELFSSSFDGILGPTQWQGAFGLNWSLAAGTYWVGFSGQSGAGTMPNPSARQLGNEAYTSRGTWIGLDSIAMGVRIIGSEGSLNPGTGTVPEPESWALMILGFGLIGTVSRRRRMVSA